MMIMQPKLTKSDLNWTSKILFNDSGGSLCIYCGDSQLKTLTNPNSTCLNFSKKLNKIQIWASVPKAHLIILTTLKNKFSWKLSQDFNLSHYSKIQVTLVTIGRCWKMSPGSACLDQSKELDKTQIWDNGPKNHVIIFTTLKIKFFWNLNQDFNMQNNSKIQLPLFPTSKCWKSHCLIIQCLVDFSRFAVEFRLWQTCKHKINIVGQMETTLKLTPGFSQYSKSSKKIKHKSF